MLLLPFPLLLLLPLPVPRAVCVLFLSIKLAFCPGGSLGFDRDCAAKSERPISVISELGNLTMTKLVRLRSTMDVLKLMC